MSPMLMIILGGGGFLLVLLVVGAVVSIRSEKALVDKRLDQYFDDEYAKQEADDRSSKLGDWVNDRMAKSSFGDGIAKELARADIKLKPAEYVASQFIAAIGAGAVAWLIGGRSIIFALLGCVLGWFLPRIYVRMEQSKRLIRFDGQLADMLNLMVNGLRAGYSTPQAMESVSREMPPPICDEFHRVTQEMQLGLPMEVALENLLRRIPSEDLDLVITAINVQREVGGNLAEILDTISYTIRERVRIKGEIRVLTTQAMTSGKFLAMLPLILAAVLWVVNRDYMMEFFNPETRLPGIIAIVFSGLLVISGYFAMTKIATVEI